MIRCTVYDSLGALLFSEEGVDKGAVAVVASGRVRESFPFLTGVEWKFERIAVPVSPHVPDVGLEDWAEHVLSYRAELEANDG